MSKETVFYGSLRAMTDQWMDMFGYFAPAVVTDTQREYRAVRETAGLMDFSMLRKVDLDGPGALWFVNSIVCREVSTLAPGGIAYGPLCDVDGKMVDDCTVMPRSAGGDRVRFCGANDRDYEILRAPLCFRALPVRFAPTGVRSEVRSGEIPTDRKPCSSRDDFRGSRVVPRRGPDITTITFEDYVG